ncbi:hypothetical protein BCT69_10520 [Enterovibrio norvegicus]|nr:hypothetical protein BCT69_10520 [Enterovibrio norvegicus]
MRKGSGNRFIVLILFFAQSRALFGRAELVAKHWFLRTYRQKLSLRTYRKVWSAYGIGRIDHKRKQFAGIYFLNSKTKRSQKKALNTQ